MDPLVPMLLAIVALAIGLALGWLVGRGRSGALADERGRAADQLRTDLAEVTRTRDEALRDIATLQADTRNFEARMKELIEAKEALISPVPRGRGEIALRGAEAVSRARRRPLQPGQ